MFLWIATPLTGLAMTTRCVLADIVVTRVLVTRVHVVLMEDVDARNFRPGMTGRSSTPGIAKPLTS